MSRLAVRSLISLDGKPPWDVTECTPLRRKPHRYKDQVYEGGAIHIARQHHESGEENHAHSKAECVVSQFETLVTEAKSIGCL